MHLPFIICVTLRGEKQKSVLIFQYDMDFRVYIIVVIAADWNPIPWNETNRSQFFVS